MPVKSSIEFFEVIEKSRLLSSAQLAAAGRLSEAESDPKSMARSLIRDGLLNKWQAMHLLSGHSALMLGKYTLLDQLDSGSGPRMFLAEDPESERSVALVMLGDSRASRSPETTAQQIESASKLVDLQHKSIQPTLAVEFEGNRCFLVVHSPTGQTLRRLLQVQGPLPTDRVIDYVSQIAAALAYAAQRGVAHGDLRLENVRVDEQGTLQVMHLGLASLVESSEGTDGAGQPSTDAQHADLVALGSILFGLLTGKPAKTPPSVNSLLEQRPDVPKPLVKCLERLIASDPNARYGSIDDLVEDLRSVAGAKPPPVPRTKSRATQERRRQQTSSVGPEKLVALPESLPTTQPAIQADPSAERPGPKIMIAGAPDATSAPPATSDGFKIKAPKRRAGQSSGLRRPATRRKAGLPKNYYVIGGAAFAGLVMLVAVAWIAMNLLAGGDQTQVAQTSTADPDSSGAAVTSASSAESDPGLDVVSRALPEETDPELPIPPTVPTPVAETRVAPDPETQADSEEGSSTDLTADLAASEQLEPDLADAETASDTHETAETVGPLAMADDQDAASEPEDLTETPAADESESESPAAKSPPAPVMPDAAPFADMASTVNLPAVDSPNALEPTTLGVVHTIRTREGQCYIRMRGGEHALRGNRVFSMRNSDRGTADWDWDIHLRDGSEGTETKIAHLTLNDQMELQFQWMPAAQNDPAAAHLMNCVFALTCRGQRHTLALRQPMPATGLTVNLKESANRHTIKLANAPDPEKIRLEIKNVRGSEYAMEPHPVLPAERGEAWIKLAEGGGMLSLRLEVDMRRDLQLTVTPHAQLNPDAQPERINVRQLQHLKNQRMAAVNQWGAMVQKGQAFMKSKASEQEKKQAAQHLRNYENELKLSQENFTRFEQFEQMLEKAQLEIIFRVFYDADGSETDLLLAGS
ncbi:MAG: hypothetical protein EA424_06700 [Planctomycetaceae bacterium]|nr:MAG: hypothetical protein EA424_06700 [Planctomycetaceae bacterium]